MKIRIFLLGCVVVFVFAHLAESGGAVAKAKAKNIRPRIHVQIPKPRIHLTQTPVFEGKPTVHLTSSAHPPAPPLIKVPEPAYASRVLSTEKPDLGTHAAAGPTSQNAENVVDLPQLVNFLRTSSQAWPLIVDNKDKQVVVQEFIDRYRAQGVRINKSASFYSHVIDGISQRSPQMLDLPFERVLQVVTVMEYDFDNGQDKEVMAQKLLGAQVYEKNKQRLMTPDANGSSE